MKKLAFGAMLIGLLVACGGGDKKNNISIVDGSTVDTPGACNPLTQAGCMAGEKCTWLVDALMPQYVGHTGCAPDGTAAIGDACMFGMPGATGYDNCVKGSVCGNYRGGAGVCKAICDQQGGTPMCDAQHVCVTYSGLFSTGDTTPAAGGVCDLACDPVTDNDYDGSGAKTKTTQTCGTAAAVGCYGYPSFGTPPKTGWSCTNDINSMEAGVGLRHRVQCIESNNCADPGPTIYVNSCNQGYLPLLRESTMVSTAVCIALCEPLVCYNGQCGQNNANRLGKAPGTGTQGGRCNGTDRVGTFDTNNDADGGEHCTHLWYFEEDDQGTLLRSPTSDSLGFCYDHGKYQYDSNGDNMADMNYPNCGMLGSGTGSGSNPAVPLEFWGALDLGCVTSAYRTNPAQGKPGHIAKKKLVDFPRALYRRTMGTRQ